MEDRLDGFLDVEELIAFVRSRDQTEYDMKNDVLAALCRVATSQGREGYEQAGILVIWLFSGAMRNISREIGKSPLNLDELDSEMVAGFWEEVSAGCRRSRGFSSRLYHAARRRAWKAVIAARKQEAGATEADLESMPDLGASGNPSAVLEAAESEGILSDAQAELIEATRIEGQSVASVACGMGLSREAAGMRRKRAEDRLASWLLAETRPSN